VGILEIRDAETGEVVRLDTSLARVRDSYRARSERLIEERRRLLQSHHMDHVLINAAEPYDIPLVRFFEERQRRYH
jgi:hypothetical protein